MAHRSVSLSVTPTYHRLFITAATIEIKEPEKFNTYDPLFDPAQAAEHQKLHAEGKGEGLYALGIVGVHMNSLAMASSRAREIQALAPTSATAPGLVEQYAIQRRLAAADGAELEICSLPGFYSFPSMVYLHHSQGSSTNDNRLLEPPSPGKKYITLAVTLNKPYSRGTIVRLCRFFGDPTLVLITTIMFSACRIN